MRKHIKRFLDIIFGSILLIIFSPLLVVISLLVWWKLGSPIIFRHVRPGFLGHPFLLYKFRTMTNKKDKNGELLPNDRRITPFGEFLRKWSLDELPELWNVIKGDMNFVGPRPLLMEYLPLYTTEQMRRHEVKPGITGWAQVNGRNAISWEEKFAYDVWYVDNWSIGLDFKILWLTVKKVIKREGINADGYISMPKFKGLEVERKKTEEKE
jgi:lipopolysaccharide/colanic/teichoic acid biosynthesis glycosyltransferase